MSMKSNRRWKIESRDVAYQGFYNIDAVSYSRSMHSGDMSDVISCELFVRGDVVGVLPYDPVRDEVALIEQFRIGAMNNTPDPWLVQIIAGMIDTDESPDQVAIREAQEEAGITIGDVTLIAHYLASPGASPEENYIFYAETDLSQIGGTHGLLEEDEDILVKVVSAKQAIAMLDAGEIRNALSVVALQWLKIKRLTEQLSAL